MLKRTAREIVLGVRDDGRGLPRSERARDGVGIRIMRHRAKAIGGGASRSAASGTGGRR